MLTAVWLLYIKKNLDVIENCHPVWHSYMAGFVALVCLDDFDAAKALLSLGGWHSREPILLLHKAGIKDVEDEELARRVREAHHDLLLPVLEKLRVAYISFYKPRLAQWLSDHPVKWYGLSVTDPEKLDFSPMRDFFASDCCENDAGIEKTKEIVEILAECRNTLSHDGPSLSPKKVNTVLQEAKKRLWKD